jgi:hypothetical protein
MSEFREMNDWVRLARMPWSVLTAGLDFMWRVSLPPGYYERYGGAMSDWENRWGEGPTGSGRRRESRESREGTPEGERRGAVETSDDDLSGDDVKLVRYKLLFTKRGHERMLDNGEEVISYDTNAASYAGRLINRHLAESTIPDEDQRYLKVDIRVLRRFPKQSVDYDGRMVDLMSRQVEILDSLEHRITPQGGGRVAA